MRNLFDVSGITKFDFVAIQNDYLAFSLIYDTYVLYKTQYDPFVAGNVSIIPSSTTAPPSAGSNCAPDYPNTGIPRQAAPIGKAENTSKVEQNVPNPLDGYTTFHYQLAPATQRAELLIRRATDGKLVTRIPLSIGASTKEADLHSYPTGTYFYTLLVDEVPVNTRRLVIR